MDIVKEIPQTSSRSKALSLLRPRLKGLAKENQYYAWTINIPTKALVERMKIRPKPPSLRIKYMKYESLNIDQQINYIRDYIDELLKCPLFPTHKGIYGGFEINSSGNIHLHCIVYTEASTLDIINTRKLCAQHRVCQTLHRCRNEMRLNYIHEIKDVDEWIDYITKDYIKLGRTYNEL